MREWSWGGRVARFVCLVALAMAAAVAVLPGAAEPEPIAVAARYGRFCGSGAPIRSVSTSQKVVAFTFDDGPWPTNTAAVMSHMEKYGWRATFFMIGNNVRSYQSIAKSVVDRGHSVAAHSMTHRYGVSTIANEVRPSIDIIEQATGVRTSFFRSPGLTLANSIDNAVFTNGACNISTASDLGDWKSPRASASTLCQRYKNALKPGAIILLHDGGSHKQTIDALPCMLEYTRQQGYAVVDLGDLLAGSYVGPAPTPPPVPTTPPAPTEPPTPPPAGSVCARASMGNRGATVLSVQRAVMNDGIYLRGGADGSYGAYTRDAVKAYQSKRGIAASGNVDDVTSAAMGLCSAPPDPNLWAPVRLSERGTMVAAIQRAIINSGIYLTGGSDGAFGSYTETAVKTYQSRHGLAASGIVDEATARALGVFNPPLPKASTMAAAAEPMSVLALAAPGPADAAETDAAGPDAAVPDAAEPEAAGDAAAGGALAGSGGTAGTARVGDLVWLDADGDGVQSTTEAGARGVEVRLVDSSGVTLQTVVTGLAGEYVFGNVAPGAYWVDFVLPDGHAFSPGDAIADDERDSDTALVEERIAEHEIVARVAVTVSAGDENLTIDVGLVPAPLAAGAGGDASSPSALSGAKSTGPQLPADEPPEQTPPATPPASIGGGGGSDDSTGAPDSPTSESSAAGTTEGSASSDDDATS